MQGRTCIAHRSPAPTRALKTSCVLVRVGSRSCRDADAGQNCTIFSNGTYGLCLTGSSGCRGGTLNESDPRSYPDSLCGVGLTGPFCAVCAQPTNDSGIYYYDDASDIERAHCRRCSGAEVGLTVGALFGALLGAAALYALWAVRLEPRMSEQTRQTLGRWRGALGLQTKLKQLYGFCIIVTKIDSVCTGAGFQSTRLC